MKRTILYTITLLIAFNAHAQEKKWVIRGYISPGIGKSFTQQRISESGQLTSINLVKSSDVLYGGGLEVLRKFNNNWLIGAEYGYITKGNLTKRETRLTPEGILGKNYKSVEISFIEIAIFAEKQFELKNPKYRLMLDAGIFHGNKLPSAFDFGLEAKGNDFGTKLAGGIQRGRVFLKVEYEKGLIKIKNNVNPSYQTSIFRFKIGYSSL